MTWCQSRLYELVLSKNPDVSPPFNRFSHVKNTRKLFSQHIVSHLLLFHGIQLLVSVHSYSMITKRILYSFPTSKSASARLLNNVCYIFLRSQSSPPFFKWKQFWLICFIKLSVQFREFEFIYFIFLINLIFKIGFL